MTKQLLTALLIAGISATARAEPTSVDNEALAKHTYWKSFQNGVVGSDETYTSHNFLDLEFTPAGIKFSQYTNFYNGHSCFIYGLASSIEDSIYEMQFEDYDGQQCRFQIRLEQNRVWTGMVEGNRSCMTGCGMRGSLYESEFPVSSLNQSPHEELSDYEVCSSATNGTMKSLADGAFADIRLEFDNRSLTVDKCSSLIPPSDTTKVNEDPYEHLGLVSPVCVGHLIRDGLDQYRDCVARNEPVLVTQSEDEFGRNQLIVESLEQPQESRHRYTTTEQLWIANGLIEFVENNGGSGSFSRVVGLPIFSDDYFATRAGDRCNDGRHAILWADESLTYARQATPFRILNPTDDTDWRSIQYLTSLDTKSNDSSSTVLDELENRGIKRPFNDYAPYTDITNSASACVGYIVVSESAGEDNSFGMLLTPDYHDIHWSDDEEINDCVGTIVSTVVEEQGQTVPDSDYIVLDVVAFQDALSRNTCKKGNLGSW